MGLPVRKRARPASIGGASVEQQALNKNMPLTKQGPPERHDREVPSEFDELRTEWTHAAELPHPGSCGSAGPPQEDPLTGLLNRRGFDRSLGARDLLRPVTGRRWAALADLDDSSRSTTPWAFEAGTGRSSISQRPHPERHVRASDSVARIGGDDSPCALARQPRRRLCKLAGPRGVVKASFLMRESCDLHFSYGMLVGRRAAHPKTSSTGPTRRLSRARDSAGMPPVFCP